MRAWDERICYRKRIDPRKFCKGKRVNEAPNNFGSEPAPRKIFLKFAKNLQTWLHYIKTMQTERHETKAKYLKNLKVCKEVAKLGPVRWPYKKRKQRSTQDHFKHKYRK